MADEHDKAVKPIEEPPEADSVLGSAFRREQGYYEALAEHEGTFPRAEPGD